MPSPYFRPCMSGRFWIAIISFAVLSVTGCHASTNELRIQAAFAIQNGLDFVTTSQTATGGFVTDCWRADHPEQNTQVDAIFTAAQVLYSLSFCRESACARSTEQRAASYLIAQQEPPGVWHYYGHATKIDISPDVDDTSVSWVALKRLNVSIPPAALDAVRRSRNEKGLFNTWIGNPSDWVGIDSRDIDTVINLNALLLFGLAREKIENVCNFELDQVANDGFRRGTVYYRSPLMFAHAFSRAYREGDVKCLKQAVPKLRDAVLSWQTAEGGWGNDLETAFGALTLLNLDYRGEPLDRAVKALLARQSSDGGWDLAPAYCGAVAPLNYGARALTTAVAIEVLAKYSALQ